MSTALNHSPKYIVRQLLVDLDLGTDPSLSEAWPIYDTSEPDTPDNCITVYGPVGIEGGHIQYSGQLLVMQGIQLRIRSLDPETGWLKAHALARAIDETVYQDTVTLSGSTYYIQSITRRGDIIELGKDYQNSERYLFTVNAVVALRRNS
jgi:hypothetical protein